MNFVPQFLCLKLAFRPYIKPLFKLCFATRKV
jgi:hypothetical protein